MDNGFGTGFSIEHPIITADKVNEAWRVSVELSLFAHPSFTPPANAPKWNDNLAYSGCLFTGLNGRLNRKRGVDLLWFASWLTKPDTGTCHSCSLPKWNHLQNTVIMGILQPNGSAGEMTLKTTSTQNRKPTMKRRWSVGQHYYRPVDRETDWQVWRPWNITFFSNALGPSAPLSCTQCVGYNKSKKLIFRMWN